MKRATWLSVLLLVLALVVSACGSGGGGSTGGGTTPSNQTATPTFSPAPGTYTSTQSVTLACTTPSSTIYYTTNNQTPTTSSTQYTTAIPVNTTTTIRAIAVASGRTNSVVASGTYTINLPTQTATPTFSGPAPGTYTSTQSVTLACATSGSSIYYTTNGTTPSGSSTPYTGAISVSTTTTIRAIAQHSGLTDSGILVGTYTFNNGTKTLSWPAVTTDRDGHPLAELLGYRIYHCTGASACSPSAQLTTTTNTAYTHTGLAAGYHCYAVRAYNSGGNSDPTATVCKQIP